MNFTAITVKGWFLYPRMNAIGLLILVASNALAVKMDMQYTVTGNSILFLLVNMRRGGETLIHEYDRQES